MSKNQELIDAVLASAKGGQQVEGGKKLACAEGFELARRFGAKPIEIGRICNQHNIQICKCQLGCFA